MKEKTSDKTVDVTTGEVRVSGENAVIVSRAIGSCVAVAAYDRVNRIGGIAHIMLPKFPGRENIHDNKYAGCAIETLLSRMKRLGADIRRTEIYLAGGANVLKKKSDVIWRENSDSVINILKKRNLKIKAKSIGGTERRSLYLHTKKGVVYCSIGDKNMKKLAGF